MNLPAEVGMAWILVAPFAMVGVMKWMDRPMSKTTEVLLCSLFMVMTIFILVKEAA